MTTAIDVAILRGPLWSLGDVRQDHVKFGVGQKRLSYPLSISAAILSSLEYTSVCSATCGVMCAVGGADNAIDVPVPRGGSTTARLLTLMEVIAERHAGTKVKDAVVTVRGDSRGNERFGSERRLKLP